MSNVCTTADLDLSNKVPSFIKVEFKNRRVPTVDLGETNTATCRW